MARRTKKIVIDVGDLELPAKIDPAHKYQLFIEHTRDGQYFITLFFGALKIFEGKVLTWDTEQILLPLKFTLDTDGNTRKP